MGIFAGLAQQIATSQAQAIARVQGKTLNADELKKAAEAQEKRNRELVDERAQADARAAGFNPAGMTNSQIYARLNEIAAAKKKKEEENSFLGTLGKIGNAIAGPATLVLNQTPLAPLASTAGSLLKGDWEGAAMSAINAGVQIGISATGVGSIPVLGQIVSSQAGGIVQGLAKDLIKGNGVGQSLQSAGANLVKNSANIVAGAAAQAIANNAGKLGLPGGTQTTQQLASIGGNLVNNVMSGKSVQSSVQSATNQVVAGAKAQVTAAINTQINSVVGNLGSGLPGVAGQILGGAGKDIVGGILSGQNPQQVVQAAATTAAKNALGQVQSIAASVQIPGVGSINATLSAASTPSKPVTTTSAPAMGKAAAPISAPSAVVKPLSPRFPTKEAFREFARRKETVGGTIGVYYRQK